jgi:O-6-methylguanine DNA methyltransferase
MKKDVFREKIDKNPGLTLFQKKVLKIVLKIPKGEARSYAWVAEKVGNPKASRAVGQALKKNPYAPVVPCHRVIASSGKIGGYLGGSTKKQKLLRKEGVRCS